MSARAVLAAAAFAMAPLLAAGCSSNVDVSDAGGGGTGGTPAPVDDPCRAHDGMDSCCGRHECIKAGAECVSRGLLCVAKGGCMTDDEELEADCPPGYECENAYAATLSDCQYCGELNIGVRGICRWVGP